MQTDPDATDAAGAGDSAPGYQSIRRVSSEELSTDTAQSAGLVRQEAISGRSVGARRIWMGRVVALAGQVSPAHHHGESETAVFVLRGRASFLSGPGLRERTDFGPGDFGFVPAWAIHMEANLGDEDCEAIVVRSTQENIVVALPDHPVPHELLDAR